MIVINFIFTIIAIASISAILHYIVKAIKNSKPKYWEIVKDSHDNHYVRYGNKYGWIWFQYDTMENWIKNLSNYNAKPKDPIATHGKYLERFTQEVIRLNTASSIMSEYEVVITKSKKEPTLDLDKLIDQRIYNMSQQEKEVYFDKCLEMHKII